MYRVLLKNDLVYSCGRDDKVKAWSTTNKELKYEFKHGHYVYDMVIGRDGTPLANRIVSISLDNTCRISNLQTGVEIKKVNCNGWCWSIAVDKG